MFLLAVCLQAPAADSSKSSGLSQWVGVYSSPSEIGGFSGTVLALEEDYRGELSFRMLSHSDILPSKNHIVEKEQCGTALAEGETLYVPLAFGYYRDRKPSLTASITKYTRLEIKGRWVLLREDALKAYRERNELYDYGILIKVGGKIGTLVNLQDIKHESIKVLYDDASKEWKDPFVNGPNKR